MSNLIRWSPFGHVSPFPRRHFGHRAFAPPAWFGDLPAPFYGRLPSYGFDIDETDAAYVVSAAVPGLAPADIKVELEGRSLTISGETKSGGGRRRRLPPPELRLGPPLAASARGRRRRFDHRVLRERRADRHHPQARGGAGQGDRGEGRLAVRSGIGRGEGAVIGAAPSFCLQMGRGVAEEREANAPTPAGGLA